MDLKATQISGVFVIEPEVFEDGRGYFFEAFNAGSFFSGPGRVDFVQDNESRSSYGVVRGLHFQRGEHAQAKLVRAVCGRILDVAVDIRPGSPTFGQHVAVELSGENKRQLFIPKGFAHGFSVLSEAAVVLYKCDAFYCPGAEGAIAWDDPDLGIDWKIAREDAVLSAKDMNHPMLKDLIL